MNNKTLRFLNFLLDTVFYFVILIVFLQIFKNHIPKEEAKWFSIIIYFFYYFIFEYVKGQTPAKMITRSSVVTIDDDKENFLLRIILRTLMRFIPLDVISYLFSYRGLHDWISKTTIIKR